MFLNSNLSPNKFNQICSLNSVKVQIYSSPHHHLVRYLETQKNDTISLLTSHINKIYPIIHTITTPI